MSNDTPLPITLTVGGISSQFSLLAVLITTTGWPTSIHSAELLEPVFACSHNCNPGDSALILLRSVRTFKESDVAHNIVYLGAWACIYCHPSGTKELVCVVQLYEAGICRSKSN